jgi:predicted PurR-regulated permease PerM
MLPTALAYIVIMGASIVGLQLAGFSPRSWQFSGALFGLNVVLVLVLFFLLDRGRIVSPAYSRLDARQVARLRELTAARMRRAPGAVEATR